MLNLDDDRFDGNLWLETGSPVKQQEVNDGRVLEVRDKGKVPSDAEGDGGGVAPVEIRHGAPAETIEA